MYHFFVPAENISDSQVVITGGDFNHIKNVLRMKPNEKFIANDGNGASYCCSIREFVGDSVVANIKKKKKDSSKAASFLYASFCFKACRKQTKWN